MLLLDKHEARYLVVCFNMEKCSETKTFANNSAHTDTENLYLRFSSKLQWTDTGNNYILFKYGPFLQVSKSFHYHIKGKNYSKNICGEYNISMWYAMEVIHRFKVETISELLQEGNCKER